MSLRRREALKYGISAAALLCTKAYAQPTNPLFTAVTTRSYDNGRSGANLNETVLTQANVATQGIRRLFSLQMLGDNRGSEAQSLIMPNIVMNDGLRHDIVIQASLSNALWTFDASTGEVLWVTNLGRPVKGTTKIDNWLINDNWGILGTPVIDPDTNILYCVSWSSTDRTSSTARFMAHAININDGSKASPSIDMSSITYAAGHGLPVMTMGTIARKQRCGLALVKVPNSTEKAVIAVFAAGAESSPTNHGWVVALDTSPFKLAAGWSNSPHYQGGGIWQGSQSPVVDGNGDIFIVAGNGSFDGITDFGECFTKLRYTPANGATPAAITCIDWWTPFTDTGRGGEPATNPALGQAPARMVDRPSNAMIHNMPAADMTGDHMAAANNEDWTDMDLGSGGALLIPSMNILLGSGKDGILYVMDSTNLGKTQLADFGSAAGMQTNYNRLKSSPIWYTYFPGYGINAAPTDLTQLNFDYANRTHHMHSTSVYYNSPVNGPMIFCCGENGAVRAWSIAPTGKVQFLADGNEIASPNSPIPSGGMPGGFLSLSANGSIKGTALLVVCFPFGNANTAVSPGFFVVYDPENFVTRADGSKNIRALWRSQDWNIVYDHCKFNVPVISGGKIYIPTYDDRVDVYGLA